MIAALGAALALALGDRRGQAQDKPKVCFVYVGPHNDGGWSQMHEDGRLMVEEKLGDKVETSYRRERAGRPGRRARASSASRASGCELIFTTSFGFMDPTIKVAEKFPDVKFEHATGFKTAPNVTTYNARFYEGRYIIGQIAGKDVEGGARRLHRLLPDPRSDHGHQLLHARRAVGQSRLQGEDRLGELLVRPGQGGGRRQGAVRPGRRHHRAAHRFDRAGCRSPRSAACTASARRTT